MPEVLSGKTVSQASLAEIKQRAEALAAKGVTPKLAIVRFGARPDDIYYEKGAKRTCGQVGVACETAELPDDVPLADALAAVTRLNDDPSVHGILVLQPMPKHIDATKVRHLISPDKDIDGMSPINAAKVFEGDPTGYSPCTPMAVMEIIKHYGIALKGKKVVVLGRSMVVGKPAAMLLLGEHATVTICHSRTQDLAFEARQADVLVAAIGKAKMVTKDYVKPGAIVIDVGINVDQNGKLCGDVDYESASPMASMITPVPGGVGSVTTAVLAKHVVRAAEKASQ
jgi:methylenetetrahydrofolate dehydrogenase (NADP+)/methenyltetrahydrofolate cyclohydrolase